MLQYSNGNAYFLCKYFAYYHPLIQIWERARVDIVNLYAYEVYKPFIGKYKCPEWQKGNTKRLMVDHSIR